MKRPTDAELENLRQQLTGVRFSFDVRAAARAERALKMLDVLTAKTATDRHAQILALGVTITEHPAEDGRDGIIKTFIAGGKAQVRTFIPATRIAPTSVNALDDAVGGRRWHRSRPAGGRSEALVIGIRMTLDPTSALPTRDAGRSEMAAISTRMTADLISAWRLKVAEPISGPSASQGLPCWVYGGSAVVATANFAARLATSAGLATGGAAALTVSGVTAATLGLYAAAGAAAIAVGTYAYCKYAKVAEPQPAILGRFRFPV